MNKKLILGALLSVGVLASCTPIVPSSSSTTKPSSSDAPASSSSSSVDATPTNLSIALNYDGNNTRITYQLDKAYSTPSGKALKKGDYKPVWAEVQKKQNVVLTEVEKAVTGKAVTYFKDNWKSNQFADIAAANVTDINSYSIDGNKETILDLSEYLDQLPNFKKFLNDNPAVRMSITSAKHGNPDKGAIYFFPYFDGYNDLEKMTLVRADYVRKLFAANTDLDKTPLATTSAIYEATEAEANGNAKAYSVVVPTSVSNNTTKTITKKSTKNIIARQNELIAAGNGTAENLVAQFKQYFAERYDANAFADITDLFLGVDSCYDADEMVALMRIVKAAPKALTGDADKKMVAFVPREYNNQRIFDLYRWAGQLWGVRGVESRSGFLYINKQGKLADARGDQEIVTLLDNLNKLYKEELILQNFENKSSSGVSDGKFAQSMMVGYGQTGLDKDGNLTTGARYAGFMEYDFAQTQGAWNEKDASKAIEGYDFRPILGGVAHWDDGDDTTDYYHFTESWRSVKTQGLVINASLANDTKKLNAALKLCDYFYSAEGQQLNSFGPESEGYTSGTIDYQGRKVAKFTEKALEQFADKNIGGNNYTNYLRQFVGATLPVGYVKEQGMEYQMTAKQAIVGLDAINKAVEVGTYKHVMVEANVTNPFMKMVPSSFLLSAGDATVIKEASAADKLGSINSDGSTSAFCIWNNYVSYGFGSTVEGKTTLTKEGYLTKVNTEWNLGAIVRAYQNAYDAMNA